MDIYLERFAGMNYVSPNPRNEVLIKRVADTIAANEPGYMQTRWFDDFVTPREVRQMDFDPDGFLLAMDGVQGPVQVAHFCDTHACIAGWATLATGKAAVRRVPGTFMGQAQYRVCLTEEVSVPWGVGGITHTYAKGEPAGGAALEIAREAFGLLAGEARLLFASEWLPRRGYSVSEALYMIAEGVVISDVTNFGAFGAEDAEERKQTEFYDQAELNHWDRLTHFQQRNIINGTATLDEPGQTYEFMNEDEEEPMILELTESEPEPIQQVVNILDAVLADRNQQEA